MAKLSMAKLSRDEVEDLIAQGSVIVIHHDRALRLNNWLDRHPGGQKAILHMVGRDASDEMDMYHSEPTLKSMKVYTVGHVELPWKSFVPPIQGGRFRTLKDIQQGEPEFEEHLNQEAKDNNLDIVRLRNDLRLYDMSPENQRQITAKYHALYRKVVEAGLFECNLRGYIGDLIRVSLLMGLAYTLFQYRESEKFGTAALVVSSLFLGLGWHQLTFVAHDAGHLAITHNYFVDNIIGVLVANFVGGLSIGWWKDNHNVHHIVTNHPTHDPDIQHLPFFAVSTKLFGNLRSTYYDRILDFDAFARRFIPYQNYTYYLILCFGRFNLYFLSWDYLIRGRGPRKGKAMWLRYFELVGLSLFAYWFFYRVVVCSLRTPGQRWLYVLVSHVATMPVHVQITLSHFAMSTSDLGIQESFAQRQLRTTMDVDCPAWLDFVHGGLQFQAIHHLFPRMPRHNFRHAQRLVVEFAKDAGLNYTIYGFGEGNAEVISHLGQVAKQARMLAEAEKSCRIGI